MGGLAGETSMGGRGGAFQPTLWSLVIRAQDPESRREALEQLIQLYWKPLYRYVRRRGKDRETSEDLTQGFFTMLLTRDSLRTVDRARGRFRTFLLTAMQNYMADEFEKSTARKRGGGSPVLSLDFNRAEEEFVRKGPVTESPDRAYQRDWAHSIMAEALKKVQALYSPVEFKALERHLASTHPEGTSYQEIARTLGTSVDDVRNRVRDIKKRYRDAVQELIRANTETEEEARDELRILRDCFS